MLRAKSLQAEVSYLTEMRGVREAQRLADAHKTVLAHREDRFWGEAVRQQVSGESAVPAAGPAVVRGLDQLRQAFGKFQEAKLQGAAVAEALQQKIGIVARTQQRIDVLQALLAKSVRLHKSVQESRRADEIADVATIARSKRHERGLGVLVEERQLPASGCELTGIPSQTIPPEAQPSAVPQLPPERFVAKVEVASPVLEVRSLEHTRESSQSSLSVTCSMGPLGSIGMRLVKRDGEGVHAILDPTVGAVAGRVVAEKAAIVTRLQGLGVKVSSLEVGVADDGAENSQATRRARARLGEGEYEDDIT